MFSLCCRLMLRKDVSDKRIALLVVTCAIPSLFVPESSEHCPMGLSSRFGVSQCHKTTLCSYSRRQHQTTGVTLLKMGRK